MRRALRIALVVVVLGGAGFMGFVAIGQIHHVNGCSRYRNALVATTADPFAAPAKADLSVLTASDRRDVVGDLRSLTGEYQRAAINDRDAITSGWNKFQPALVASILGQHGC